MAVCLLLATIMYTSCDSFTWGTLLFLSGHSYALLHDVYGLSQACPWNAFFLAFLKFLHTSRWSSKVARWIPRPSKCEVGSGYEIKRKSGNFCYMKFSLEKWNVSMQKIFNIVFVHIAFAWHVHIRREKLEQVWSWEECTERVTAMEEFFRKELLYPRLPRI